MISKRLTSGAKLVGLLSSKNSFSQTIPSLGSNSGVSMVGDSTLRRVLRSQVGSNTEFFALTGTSRHMKIITMNKHKEIINEYTLPKQTRRTAVEPVAPEPEENDTGSNCESSTIETDSDISHAPADNHTGADTQALSLTTAYLAFCKKPSSGTMNVSANRTIVTAGDDNILAMENILAVADGLGCYIKGKPMKVNGEVFEADSQMFAFHLLTYLASVAIEEPDLLPKAMLKQAYLRAIMKCDANMIIGASTAVVARLDKNVLKLAHIGDSECLVIRNGSIVLEASDMEARQLKFNTTNSLHSGDFATKSMYDVKTDEFPLQEGDIIVLGSDGVFDNLFKHQVVSYLSHLKSSSTQAEVQDAVGKIWEKVYEVARSKTVSTPWSEHCAAFNRPCNGGKVDDTSIIVAVVKKE